MRDSILDDHFRTFELEAEADFLQAFFTHRVAEAFLVAGVEHQEAATAGADEFAAQRAVGHGVVIPVIDLLVAHAFGAGLFTLPVGIHQPCKFLEVAGLERGEALVAELLGEMKILQHLGVVFLTAVMLVLENRRSDA